MNPSSNLVFIGPTGAGKTSLGKRVAERFGLQFVDLDAYISQHAGSSIADIFEHLGQAGFRKLESAGLQALLQQRGLLLATGAGAVLDPASRACMQDNAFVVHLHVSVPGQLDRLARDRTRPLLLQPDREAVLEDMARTRTPIYQALAELTLDTERHTPVDATAQLVLGLAAHWQQIPPPA